MGSAVYSTLQVMSCSDKAGMEKIDKIADDLGLHRTSIVHLPINGYLFMFVFPSGSKLNWPEEAEHLEKIQALVKAIKDHNEEKGGEYIVTLQTTLNEGFDSVVVTPPSPKYFTIVKPNQK